MKIKTQAVVSLFGMLAATFYAQAQQEFKCGLAPQLKKVYEQYPDLEREQQELLQRSHQHSNAFGDREDVYIIPVVFHVIHDYGTENISDDQILDQMEILNRDFRKQNADTSEIMTAFKPIAADTKIEFRLANKDPFGNCTNGIEHIYSHETNIGDDNSKLNQWPRSRYLNIWVVKSMDNGVAGYAYYPSAVSTGLYYADGIIIRHNYIGSIGTSSTFNSRALTHEIGHYLGLPHTWGSTNEPEVACGDDGIPDTPVTAGYLSCVLTNTDNCNAGVPENVQNYMEYSYCSRMYTEGQKAVMRNVLEDQVSSRNHLPTPESHVSAGINVLPALCTPLPDFTVSDQLICTGSTVIFSPFVSRAAVDSYSWHFPGGSPEYSSDIAPQVTYNTAGRHEVTLTVSNAAGSESVTRTDYIDVRDQNWTLKGIFMEDFENDHFYTDGWHVENPEDNESKWKLFTNAGYSGTSCIGIKHYKANPDPILDLNYYKRLGGTKDVIISPYYNLTQATSATLNFKYINSTVNSGVYDPDLLGLKVYYRKNCESTWFQLTNIAASQMVTNGFIGGNFLPTANSGWTDVNLNLPAGALANNVHFKFEFTADDYNNNFFIDDINVSGILGMEDLHSDVSNVKIYPNPAQNGAEITVAFNSASTGPVAIKLVDMVGRQVAVLTTSAVSGQNSFQLNTGTEHLSAGVYGIVIESPQGSVTNKIMMR